MTQASGQPSIRRIAVTLDASASGRAPLETAARLAVLLGAELEGVFVEDINLIRLSGLPFLREVSPWSLDGEAVSTRRMQCELRARARNAERMLQQVASETGVSWSFQVWRGRAEAASLASAFAADILSLGRISSRVFARAWVTTGALARHHPKRDASIVVLFSDSERAVRAVTTACSLAQDLGARMTLLLPEIQGTGLQGLKQKAGAILDLHGQAASLVPVTGTDVRSLAQAAGASGNRILITEAEHPLLQHAALDECLEALFSRVLLVR